MLDLELLRSFVSRGRCRRLHPRRRARPPHPIDRQPADQAAGRRYRPAAAEPQRQGRDADRSRRAAAVLCAAAAVAGGRSPRRGGAARAAKARCGSASPRISPPIAWQNCWRRFRARIRACGSTCAPTRAPICKRDLERGELDLALFKRAAGEKGGIAVWPERVHWVTSKSHPRDTRAGSVPLIGFPPGCLYRAGAIHALESAGRTWHMAYTSSEPRRHPGRGRRRHGPEHSVGDGDPGRSPRADGEGWLCADRPDRSGAGGRPRCQPGDVAAGGSAGRILRDRAGEGGVELRDFVRVGEGAKRVPRPSTHGPMVPRILHRARSPTAARPALRSSCATLNNTATRRWRARGCRRAHAP